MRWAWWILSSLAVVAAAGAPLLLRSHAAAAPGPPPKTEAVSPDSQYYVMLTLVEVSPQTGGGKAWDPRDGAPDLAYEIFWQGQRVFASSEKGNTLVAKWSNAQFDVTDLVGSGVSIDDSIKAARVTVRPGDRLEFRVYDKDTLSPDDLIGKWSVATSSLRPGDQRWLETGGQVVSAVCRVIPVDDLEFRELAR